MGRLVSALPPVWPRRSCRLPLRSRLLPPAHDRGLLLLHPRFLHSQRLLSVLSGLPRSGRLHGAYIAVNELTPQGIGLALLFLPAVSIISHWFLEKRPVAAGLVTSFSSLGGVVLPIMANNLLEKQGFKITILSMAGLVTGLLIIAQGLVKTRLPNRRERIAKSGPPPPVDMKGVGRTSRPD